MKWAAGLLGLGLGLPLYVVCQEIPAQGAGSFCSSDSVSIGEKIEKLAVVENVFQVYPVLGWGVPIQIFCN